jgi:hypothetical protein
MKAPAFPIFSLKARNGLVIAAGGGGSRELGRSNGVVVVDESTYKDLEFYETDDIIVDIEVYDPSEPVEEIGEDDMPWDDYCDGGRPLSRSSGLKEIEPGDVESNRFSKEVMSDNAIEERSGGEHVSNVMTDSGFGLDNEGGEEDKRIDDEKSEGNEENEADADLYIGCRGEKHYYLLAMRNLEIELIKKVEKVVSHQQFARDLYLICGKTLYGFYDVAGCPGVLDDLLNSVSRKRRKSPGSLLSDESYEEYSYRLSRKERRIVCRREEGSSDILNNWERFFIAGRKIHKVVIEDGKYTFVHNSKKFSYEKEIGAIMYRGGFLIYYLRGRDSMLYFQNETERTYSIPRITAMGWGEEYTSIGTADGHVYLFRGSALKARLKACDVPISGVVCMGRKVYFSSINGLIDTRPIPGMGGVLRVLAAIIVLVIAIVFGAMRLRKGQQS